jgi:hypothetical protein
VGVPAILVQQPVGLMRGLIRVEGHFGAGRQPVAVEVEIQNTLHRRLVDLVGGEVQCLQLGQRCAAHALDVLAKSLRTF